MRWRPCNVNIRDSDCLHALQKETSPEDDPVPGLEASCRSLGVPLHILDLRRRFSGRLLSGFRGELRPSGNRPTCASSRNALVKFGLWMDEARKLGVTDWRPVTMFPFAEHPRYGMALHSGADGPRTRAYFLALTPINRLKMRCFPLPASARPGGPRRASGVGLSVLPRESQEICLCPTTITAPSQGDRRASSRRGADGPARRACRGAGTQASGSIPRAPPWARRIVTEPLYVIGKRSFPQRAAAGDG